MAISKNTVYIYIYIYGSRIYVHISDESVLDASRIAPITILSRTVFFANVLTKTIEIYKSLIDPWIHFRKELRNPARNNYNVNFEMIVLNLIFRMIFITQRGLFRISKFRNHFLFHRFVMSSQIYDTSCELD